MPNLKNITRIASPKPTRKIVSIVALLVMTSANASAVEEESCHYNGQEVSVRGTITTETCLKPGHFVEIGGCKLPVSARPVLTLETPLCVEDMSDESFSRAAPIYQITKIEVDLSQTVADADTPMNINGIQYISNVSKTKDYMNKKVQLNGLLQRRPHGDPKWNWVGMYAIKVNSITPDTANAQP